MKYTKRHNGPRNTMTLFSFIPPLLNRLYDYYHTKQLDAFFTWLGTIKINPTQLIYINLPHHDYLCDFKRDNKSQIPENISENYIDGIGFILCSHNSFDATLQKLSLESKSKSSDWVNVFQSPVLEIWENTSKHPLDKRPLRFGLSNAEKSALLTVARTKLIQQLNPSEYDINELDKTTLPRLMLIGTADVALWVNGELRGSMIVENKSVTKAVKEAVVLAASDSRFKPLQFDELDATRIEITIMNNLRIPLQFDEVQKNEIYSEKGYFMHIENKNGWFVPTVFNCLQFKTLNDLRKLLLTQKMNFSSAPRENPIFIYEVFSFIESSIRTPLTLRGPIVTQAVSTANTVWQDTENIAKNAVLHLSKIQEPDGNIPPIISVLSGKSNQIDWVRLAHTTWGLTLYGIEAKNKVSTATALKAYSYLRQYIFSHRSISNLTRCLTLVYFTNTAILLEKDEDAGKGIKFISNTLPNLSYEPILFSQIASCLFKYSERNPAYLSQAIYLTTIIQTDFNKQRISGSNISLASYAELILLLQTLGNNLNNISYIEQAQEIATWYSSQQLPNGSFPSFPHSMYTYTRGTGKIFETLAALPQANEWSQENVISWFHDMQYSGENSYFIKKEIREKIIGGFRHDDTNQDVWIDSASHFLIGAARLIQQSKKEE